MELKMAVGKHEKLESFKIRNEIGKYKVGAEDFGPKLKSTAEVAK